MISFLRKYQRIFFVVITIVIIITFTFFGTQNAVRQSGVMKDRVICKALDGSKIKLSEVDRLSFFLSREADSSGERGINLFNDGVIVKDFAETKIGLILAESYFEILKGDLADRFEKVKKSAFYSYPGKEISSELIWKRHNPELLKYIEKAKNEVGITLPFLGDLLELYRLEKNFTKEQLKRLLLIEEKEAGVTLDKNLFYKDLALFGFNGPEEWFGRNYIDLISQFIINGAAVAKEKGYVVSSEEVCQSFVANMRNNLKKINDREFASRSEAEIFQYQLRILGLTESELVNLWQKVLLFRKYFNDVGNNIFVDKEPYREFGNITTQKALLTSYELPSYLQLKSSDDILSFEMYLKAVLSSKDIDPNCSYFSVQEVEKSFPELIEQDVELKVATASLDEVALRIGERDLWDWQLEDANWALLADKFYKLSSVNKEDRFTALESLNDNERVAVDGFSRDKIVALHPEWLQEILNQKELKPVSIKFRSRGTEFPFKGVSDEAKFLAYIKEPKGFYSEDGNLFCRIEVVKSPSEKRILTFREAFSDGTLKRLDASAFSQADLKAPSSRLIHYMNMIKEKVQSSSISDFVLSPDEVRDLKNQWKVEVKELSLARDLKDPWFSKPLKEKESSTVHVDGGAIDFFVFKKFEVDEEAIRRSAEMERYTLSNQAKYELADKLAKKMAEKKSATLPIRKLDFVHF